MKLRFKEYRGGPDKQRLLNAIVGEPVDRVPNFEILFEDRVTAKILGRHVGGSTLGSMKEVPTSTEALEKARRVHEDRDIESEERPIRAADYAELCLCVGQDALAIGDTMAPFFKRTDTGKKVLVKDKSFRNRKDVEAGLILPTENMDFFQRNLPYIREYREEALNKNLGFTLLVGDLFQQLYEFVFDFNSFSYLLYDDYTLIEELIEAGIEYWLSFSEYIVTERLVDFIYFADDLALKSGLFVKPDMLRDLYLRRYRKVLGVFADAGIPIVFHSDGDVSAIMDDLLEMGIDCFNPIDPYSMDYRALKKRYGRNLTLMGNIDLVFPLANGTPEDVRRDVQEHMRVCKPGYRYICATSHSMTNYVPDENVVAMIDAIHDYGLY